MVHYKWNGFAGDRINLMYNRNDDDKLNTKVQGADYMNQKGSVCQS